MDFGVTQWVNGQSCGGLTYTMGNDYLTEYYTVNRAGQYWYEVATRWDWGSYPRDGYQGATLMDRAFASCEAQMATNGLEAEDNYCCQVIAYFGTQEVPTASKW